MELVSINEIADIMNVSVQTIRNWEEKGYLKPTRTIGGHRRFDLASIRDFHKVINKELDTRSSAECDDELYRREQRIQESLKDPDVRSAGGISKENMAVLLQNQKTCKSQKNRDYAKEVIFKIAEYMSSPYFFLTKALLNSSDIVWYKRYRTWGKDNWTFVIEGEDVVSNTWKFRQDGYLLDSEVFEKIWDEIDETNIRNIIANSNTHKVNTKDSLESKIHEIINQKTWRGEDNIVIILPPELFKDDYKLQKLNPNTKKVLDFNYGIPNLEIYVSRIVPSNDVIIGNKDENNCGYLFCPYILAFNYDDQDFAIRAGVRLLREGRKFYDTIEYEE